jgi:hypothetical protein
MAINPVREVVGNIEAINGGAPCPTPPGGRPQAPACYRVSLVSGSLEVTARLKSTDDLNLLVRVLEANKPLFEKSDRLANEVLTLTESSEEATPSEQASLGKTAAA